jgi:arylsulfatase
LGLAALIAPATAQDKKPNILVIWGDDIGITNISAYSHGMMGYKTPNIDRIAKEGALFTDYYAEQSCTAGRAGFITGQIPFRTGLTKVGMPGAKQGLSFEDPTIAELLKNHGYVTTNPSSSGTTPPVCMSSRTCRRSTWTWCRRRGFTVPA